MTVSPLLTDLYQLTMGYGYWKNKKAQSRSVFHLFYRRAPFGESAVIVAGVEDAVNYLVNLKFTETEVDYLKSLTGSDGKALFDDAYMDYLVELEWDLQVKAIREGDIALPHEPIMQVEGPLIQVQLVETALLNIINFQTLIATKSAIICEAAEGDDVMEFGLRRAQGPDGGVSASRAAYVGGSVATSNVLAGLLYGIPVKGTHAHSWVMSYEDELESFEAYAAAMPNNTLLLVDTYDTVEGVKKAIEVGCKLREQGHDLLGVRLDSGDLCALSIAARRMLDEAGFEQARIVASNDLDEHTIKKLKATGAKIDTWGVGTKLVTAYDQPALGGVYKLGAIQNTAGDWQYKVKLSEDLIKVSNPGKLQVVRTRGEDGGILKDTLFNELDEHYDADLLLIPFIKNGKRVNESENIATIRERAVTAWPLRPKKEGVLELSASLLSLKKDLVKYYKK